MVELKDFQNGKFDYETRSKNMLFVCDESSINCATFRQIQKTIEESGMNVTLVMPNSEYQQGKRGWAKVQILASVAPQITGLLALDYDQTIYEISQGKWGKVMVNSKVLWSGSESISEEKKQQIYPSINVTEGQFDREMIARTKENIAKSNCWLDPAGAVFTLDEEILIESQSTSYNNSHCKEIPIDHKEVPLLEGERMLFCDSLHAERVGISLAAEKGISLEGSTIYISKFPCRPCAQSVIAAGVSRIIFEKGSYGLIETADLFEGKNISLYQVKTS